MKKIYLFAAATLALASCTSDEFFGTGESSQESNAIGFGTFQAKATRGTLDHAKSAEKLNNNFIVYGFKTNAAEAAAGGTDQKVFDRYNVNYNAGTASTTESNTADWEYVGLANHDGSINPQTIKYWDYSAERYVFSAVSGVGVTATKTTSGTAIYDKGWTVSIPAGGDLSTLYASDRVVITKDGTDLDDGSNPDQHVAGQYQQQVNLTFRSLMTKIRFAMYETIPGYSVHIDKFYYNTLGTANETNFAIDGKFKNVNPTGTTDLQVTYYDNNTAIENRPKVSYSTTGTNPANSSTYGTFGANIQADGQKLGTTSVEATYDQSDKSYTMILPYESLTETDPSEQANVLNLKVDYTLTSTDGSGEKIHVSGATANVPTEYSQWKPNFAYTYLFKISDNTNGKTDPSQPNDGLYPITFDAVVVTEETDLQETITSVSEPSITTYAQGRIVTENDEYTEGNVYFNVMKDNALCDLVNHGEVFEVHKFGTVEKITEEVVKNWRNNFCVLLPVTTNTAVTTVPLSDGTTLSFTAGNLGVFAAKAGKTYAIHYNTTDSWKVVKVAGTEDPTVEYSQTISSTEADYTITAKDDPVVYTLKASSPAANTMVIGANANMKIYDSSSNDVTTNFNITDNFDGTYNIIMTDAAIAAGANGTYTVKFNNTACAQTFKVALTYALSPASITIVTGNTTGANTVLNVNSTATDGNVTEVPDGITVKKTSTGTYKVTAAATLANGAYTVKIAGQTLNITVDTYAFYNVPEFTFNYLGTDAAKTLNLRKNYGDADVEVTSMTLPSGYESIATITKATAGAYTVVPVAPGTFTVEYENTSATIVVNQYTLTPSTASIAKSTGSTVLTLKKNNGETKTINASTAKVEVKCGGSTVTSGFSLTTNGQTLKFGNVTTAGTYTFEYTESGKVVAVATVTVTD